jgi:hypothetical protein
VARARLTSGTSRNRVGSGRHALAIADQTGGSASKRPWVASSSGRTLGTSAREWIVRPSRIEVLAFVVAWLSREPPSGRPDIMHSGSPVVLSAPGLVVLEDPRRPAILRFPPRGLSNAERSALRPPASGRGGFPSPKMEDPGDALVEYVRRGPGRHRPGRAPARVASPEDGARSDMRSLQATTRLLHRRGRLLGTAPSASQGLSMSPATTPNHSIAGLVAAVSAACSTLVGPGQQGGQERDGSPSGLQSPPP